MSALAWRQRGKKTKPQQSQNLWRGLGNKPCFHISKIPNSFDSLTQCSQTAPCVFSHFCNSLKLKSQSRIPVRLGTHKQITSADWFYRASCRHGEILYFSCFENIYFTPKIGFNLFAPPHLTELLCPNSYITVKTYITSRKTQTIRTLELHRCRSIIRQTLLLYLFQLRGEKIISSSSSLETPKVFFILKKKREVSSPKENYLAWTGTEHNALHSASVLMLTNLQLKH